MLKEKNAEEKSFGLLIGIDKSSLHPHTQKAYYLTTACALLALSSNAKHEVTRRMGTSQRLKRTVLPPSPPRDQLVGPPPRAVTPSSEGRLIHTPQTKNPQSRYDLARRKLRRNCKTAGRGSDVNGWPWRAGLQQACVSESTAHVRDLVCRDHRETGVCWA